MDIYPCGSRPSRRGPVDSFTGIVWQEPIIEAPAPARVRSGMVRFEPGARTAWHTHPLGQTLFVISGAGRVQTWGGKVREIRAGDVVWIRRTRSIGTAPRRTPTWFTSPCGIARRHAVNWMEHVTDEQYKAPVGGQRREGWANPCVTNFIIGRALGRGEFVRLALEEARRLCRRRAAAG